MKLLWWNIHEGQAFTQPLNYSPLSSEAVENSRENIKVGDVRRESNTLKLLIINY
ncbi:MAG: hypothetical protein WDM78_19950 [Puia sp.]